MIQGCILYIQIQRTKLRSILKVKQNKQKNNKSDMKDFFLYCSCFPLDFLFAFPPLLFKIDVYCSVTGSLNYRKNLWFSVRVSDDKYSV